MLFQIKSNQDEQPELCRLSIKDGHDLSCVEDALEKEKVVHLYGVMWYNHEKKLHEEKVYILAESPIGAIHQASCLFVGGTHLMTKTAEGEMIKKSIVTRERMLIRGWNNRIF